MNRTEIETAFIKAGLVQRTPEIDLLVRDSVRLRSTPADEATLKPGSSKLGGHPDLPTGTPWPEFKGQPQSFLAQIQLADLQGIDSSRLLPRLGMLWFFYDAHQETFGDQPQDRDGWHIIFSDKQPATLQRLATPAKLPADSLFQSCTLTPSKELTLALQPELELPAFDWSNREQQAYENILAMLRKPDELAVPHHRLLGYPDTIQDDMRLQCQLVSNGITDSADPRVAAMQQDAADWLLLLQIDTDSAANMRWANNGMLYYWIRRSDLRARRFDKSWLVLQSE
ncbi:MAG TPA: YwqG family protein [Ktedonobacteraceae bacterium]|nr:YwqG family protein [Ktedonobacteraceae bacterium]